MYHIYIHIYIYIHMHYPEWPRELNDTSKLVSTEFVFSLSAINLRWECVCACLSVRIKGHV